MKKIFFLLMLLGNLIRISGQATFEGQDRERISKNKVKRQIQWGYDYQNGTPGTKGYKYSVTTFDKGGNPVEIINLDTKDTTSVITYTYDSDNNKTSYSRFKGNRKDLIYNQIIKYDAKGSKLVESGFDGSFMFSNTFTYNSNGKVAEIKYTTAKTLTEKRTFKYIDKTTEMTIWSPANAVLSKELMIYDNKNNVLEETKYIQDNVAQKANYAYDPKGKKVEEIKENLGKFAFRKKFTYDAAGNITEIIEEKAGFKAFPSFQYKYDTKGNVIEEKWTKDPGKEYSKKTHTYDAKGLLSETNFYNATYKLFVLYKYTYEYF